MLVGAYAPSVVKLIMGLSDFRISMILILIITGLGCIDENQTNSRFQLTFPAPLGAWVPRPEVGITAAKTAPAFVSVAGEITPLYSVADPNSILSMVGYQFKNNTITAIASDGSSLWQTAVSSGSLFSFGDFDNDGFVDLGLVHYAPFNQSCSGLPMTSTSMDFLTGKSGLLTSQIVPPVDDLCWNFNGSPAATHQLTGLSILRSTSEGPVSLVKYYAQQGTILTSQAGGVLTGGNWIFPSIAAFDSTYLGVALPNAYGTGHSFIQNSHSANGLQIGNRLVFFTSGRVVQYDLSGAMPQLVADHPFLSGDRTDLAGRNYGTVSLDPITGDDLWLVTGTPGQSLYCDILSGSMAYDPWGGIERHITHYKISTNGLEDQFVSYAHDGGDAYQYEWRLVYPANTLLQVVGEESSRLVWNTYQGGRWTARISAPGSLKIDFTQVDLFVWDVRDLDGNGTPEIIASPASQYFPEWRTVIYRWIDGSLSPVQSFAGAIPVLRPRFHHETANSMDDSGYIFPVATEIQSGRVILRTQAGRLRLVDINTGSMSDQDVTNPSLIGCNTGGTY